MSHIRILAVPVLLVLSAVMFPYGQKKPEFKVIEEDGVPVAVNPDRAVPGKDSPKDIMFKERFRIGLAEGDPNYVFGPFISFTVDEHAHVYVLDWRGKTVRKFNDGGDYLLGFGGPGQGPGEFSSPEAIRFLPNGQLMVFEGESQKYSCFTKDGRLVRTGRFQKLMFPPYFGLTNGHVIAVNVLHDSDKTESILGIYDERCDLVKELSRGERKADPPWPTGGDLHARARRIADAISRVAFRPQNLAALDGSENIYFAFTDKYEIRIMRADGRLNRIIRTELPCLPVREKDRRAFLETRLPEDISTWRTMDESLRNQIQKMIEFPKKMPAFLGLIPMDDGYLLVVRRGHYGHNALINIFDPSGRLIIEKELPFGITEGICRGGRLYTISKDEDGNRYVQCYSYQLVQ